MTDWSAALIVPDQDFAGAPLLRREFALEAGHGDVASATLHASAHGVFEAFLNGQPVADEVLSPGWSAYEWRLRYRSYDVTALLRPTSVLGFALGNGWWGGRLGWNGGRGYYGSDLGVVAQLEITFADGHVQRVLSDGSWTAGPSAVLANDLYDGQTIDGRRVSDAWLAPGFTGEGWTGVHAGELDLGTLTPYIGPPVRRQAELAPVSTWTAPSGRTLVDFGQNLVGWVRVRVSGPAGTEVTLRHAEVLEHDELGVRPLRSAQATDRFVLSGGDDVFEPTFTFHGFRYAEVDGWPGEPAEGDLTAVVVSSDLERIGQFACSDDLLNQLHSNAVWGTVGNFLDVPTDCPQRDERLGWTGDIAAFTPSAAFLFDVEPFLRDWLRDLAAEQQAADGMVAFVIPDVLKYVTKDDAQATSFPAPDSTAVWSDAAVWVPWALWQAYGDRQVLVDQFDSMAAHVRRVETLTSPTGLWDTGFQFGDWLDPTAPPENPILAKADHGVVATACLFRSATIVAETAALLGRAEDQAHFTEVAARTRAAFAEHYVGADGHITSDAVTVYALAIVFGLVEGEQRRLAGERLVELVDEGGYRILTGFAGTPFVTDALTTTGHLDDAYRLLLQQECPSWLYPVTMGATTIWERWDSMLPDGSINPGQMTSFNHYALGAVVDWMHRTLGGLAPLEPGYAKVLVAPQPGGGITWARTALQTRHGRVAVSWSTEGPDGFSLDVELPEGVSGLVRLPDGTEREIGAGEHHLAGEPATA
ncbi:alpha-L-rhamnosidase [Friedmanniella luteola]|uniref:alpha-L-rhamnosidase n=1 Tax=Friedmanniella luteola TaxID=546871 RepID=A0A1H1ZC48_9ACTN|nr:alpha-L-rhamnosidase [Friedmanniella luteola]SDT31250.1 alpha-L-rhamnosidase [Friedmanniella luteola]